MNTGARIDVGDGWGARITPWSVADVEVAIHERRPIPLLDSDELVNPDRVLVWAPHDIDAERARRAESAERWRRTREDPPQPGSPAWIRQRPVGTRWFYKLFGPR